MSAFDQTTFVEDDKFKVVELDSTGEGGEFNIPIKLEEGAELVSVLIEGAVLNPHAFIGDVRLEADDNRTVESQSGHQLTQIDPTGNQLLLSGLMEAGQRAKITVLVLYRRIRNRAWGMLSCAGCKRLVRFLIKSMFTGGIDAIPDIILDGVIPEEFWQLVSEWLNENTPFPDVVQVIIDRLDPYFVEQFKYALRWLVEYIQEALEPINMVINEVLTEICRLIGFCPQEPQRTD